MPQAHLGDYIYEYKAGGERASDPQREIFTLYDYRARHGQYRSDPDLQLLSQNWAWIPTWDDHGESNKRWRRPCQNLTAVVTLIMMSDQLTEVSNNGYRDGSSGLNNTEESFIKSGGVSVDQRKMNAVRAYFEWLPIR